MEIHGLQIFSLRLLWPSGPFVVVRGFFSFLVIDLIFFSTYVYVHIFLGLRDKKVRFLCLIMVQVDIKQRWVTKFYPNEVMLESISYHKWAPHWLCMVQVIKLSEGVQMMNVVSTWLHESRIRTKFFYVSLVYLQLHDNAPSCNTYM